MEIWSGLGYRRRGTHDGDIFRVVDLNGRTSRCVVIGRDRPVVVDRGWLFQMWTKWCLVIFLYWRVFYWIWLFKGRTKGCLVICLDGWVIYWGVRLV